MKMCLNLELYSSIAPTHANRQNQLFNIDNDEDGDAFETLLRLLQFLQTLDREQKEKGTDYFQF
jgi:hypothetical protein